ncbi:septal ring lytic transglycosylase RlpA family protein [Sphingomicrobium sp. XHP0235]|uniref:septal ring lytic transglycosylase RlpA family protein n=1 Tax=Sphingomicrobium aquimarinum TaxID=3133971 RepID=UPI0031FE7519
MGTSTIQSIRGRLARTSANRKMHSRLRVRLSVFAILPALAVAGFAPAEPVDAGDNMPRDMVLRVGQPIPDDAMITDLSVLAEKEESAATEEVLTPVRASYYGKRFAGRPTASGEIFNPAAMTAAHRTLPFGTMVEVTNVRNGKAVTVRINDRGPFHGNRAIDLSRAASDAIGMTPSGTGTVTLRTIS